MEKVYIGYRCEDLVENKSLRGLEYQFHIAEKKNTTACQPNTAPTDDLLKCGGFSLHSFQKET